MESRLQLCLSHLKEVEARLLKLQSSASVGSLEHTEVTASLELIRKALEAVTETQSRVRRVRAKHAAAGRQA